MDLHSPTSPRQLDRTLFDVLAEGVVWHAADGRVVDANAAAAPILGLTRDELLGRTSRDPRWYAVHEDGSLWPGEEHPASVALRTGVPQRGAIMGVMAPGQGRRWISIHAMPLFEDGGARPTGVVASFADVTPQIDLRRQLEASTRELGELYEQAPCGYHVLDAQGRFQRINRTGLLWLGLQREQVLGRLGLQDFLSRDSRTLFHAAFPRVLAGEPLDGLELELVGAQGQRRTVRLNAEPVRNLDARVVAGRLVLHDITDLRARSLALEKLNAEQSAVLDNDLVGIVRVRRRRIVWTNRAFGRIFGYACDELPGRSSEILFDDVASYLAFGEVAFPKLRAGESFRGRLALRHKDGRRVLADCSGVMMEGDDAEVMWFVLDVTEQHRAAELRQEATRLENENRQLRETGRLHQVFLSNMSHELRTPLHVVIGYAELLQLDAGSGDAAMLRAYADEVAGSAHLLLSMIESILETAHAEAGRIVLQPTDVDVEDAVDLVVDLLAPKAVARSVDVHPDVAVKGPIRLDPLRLRQVLLHYLDNAIKFSHPGGRVLVRAGLDGRGWLRIEVEDQGIGIAADDLPSLFTRFHQLSSGSTKLYEGAGIGLALVKMLVEAQGGEVGVSSAPGTGSVFHAVLPPVPPVHSDRRGDSPQTITPG